MAQSFLFCVHCELDRADVVDQTQEKPAKLRSCLDHRHPEEWHVEKIRSPNSFHVQQVTLQVLREALRRFWANVDDFRLWPKPPLAQSSGHMRGEGGAGAEKYPTRCVALYFSALETYRTKVKAALTPTSPSAVDVQFLQFRIGPLRIKAPESAKGSLDTTFVDEEMRISRGDKGNLFVLTKPEGLEPDFS